MTSYTPTLTGLVNLRQLHRGDPWDDLWHDWREDWRHLKFDLHIEPPSWVLGDMALEARLSGIVFPSLTHEGGANIVAYVGKLAKADRIDVNDPDRSEERRVGKECVSTCRSRGSRDHSKKKIQKNEKR